MTMEKMMSDEVCRDFIKKIPYGLIMTTIEDPDDLSAGKILHVSKSAITMLQLEEAGNVTMGRTIGEAFPGLDKTILSIVYKSAVKSGETKRAISFLYGSEDIPENYFRVELIPLENNKYMAAIFINISAQVALERKVKDQIKELEEVNKYMKDRELRIIELKRQVKKLTN